MERINVISPDVTGPGRIGRVALADIVRRSARKFPEKTAIVDDTLRVTYAEFDADVDRLANALLAKGLRKGDRVATLCANSYRLAVAIFGIARAGLVWLPINFQLRPDDVDYILGHAEPRFAIVDDKIYAGALGAVLDARVSTLAIVSYDASVSSDRESFDDLLRAGDATEPDVDIDDRDVCQIMYTSGTTGRPKGVMHTHLSVFVAFLSNVIDFEIRSSDVSNVTLPLFHCGEHCLFGSLFVAGATAVMMRDVDAGALIETISRERLTLTLTLPPFYAAMLDHPALATSDISSLRLCVYGMMQMPEPVLRRLLV
ncbi:MAG: AMP-binding protein, partial [Candidatus Eremiobacteraeota bacterium]|nr:AMP-binding protein [Candidatus Eremiobacteraeota bacterium]